MAKPKLKLAESKTPQERAMEQIEASWATWVSDTGQPWRPVENTKPLSRQISESLDKGRLVIVSKPYVPFWRRILRRLKGLG